MKKDINEKLMTTKQQVTQMNHYWKDLNHTASDVVKKKNMDRRFGIKNIKLDRYGNIISFDKYKRGAHEDHNCMDEAVGKFMSGEVGIKGERVKVEVEVSGVDNKKRIYHAKVLAPKEHFGLELQIPAKVMHRGKWIKTKTGKASESVDWKKFDTPFGDRHGKKFDSWDEWEKIEKEREKLEKTQNGKKQMNNVLMPRSPKNKNKTYEHFMKETKEDMEYTTEDMEEVNSLIEEIDILCKDSTTSPLREDQMCEFLLLKEAVNEGKLEELRIQAEASKVPSKGLSPAQRRKMSIRMKIMAKKPGFIKKRLRALKRAATKAVIAVRARKAAIKLVVKKFFPKLRTKKKSELSYSERGKISQIVKKKSKIIDRFAKKLLITTRKKDVERRKAMSGRKDKAGVKGES